MAKISINMKEGTLAEDTEVIIGIDLGTTNSLVAYMNGSEAEIVKDDTGSKALVPSVVHFSAQNEIIVGEEAKKFLVTEPERTIFSVKRLLGKSYEDLNSIKDYLGYRIIDQGEDQLVKIAVDDKYYSPIELSAEILKKLKHRIEKQLNKEVTKAVITVPAYFNDSQRQATKDAGKLAGLDVLRIINEPTAASLAYGIGRSEEEQMNVAVYDLGGGTFDISLLSIHDGIFEVLSTNGDTFLGGDDFDRIIIQHWVVNYQLHDLLHTDDKSMMQGLRLLAEEAKVTLGKEEIFSKKYRDQTYELTRDRLNQLIKPLIEQSIEACGAAIKDAGLELSQIDKILMVGGSTRVPLVRSMISNFFGKQVDTSLDPDQVVALGAAIQADVIAGKNKDLLLLDITPLSLGIETVGGLMDTIIPRNSKIPIKSGRSYTTSVDGQKNLKLGIYQGERDLVADNRKLGEFILKDIPPMAAGIPKITVHFIIDADGILKVRAMEERSNTQTEVVIKSQYGISEEEMAKMLIDSIQNAELDVAQRSLLEARNEGNNVVNATAKFLKQNEWLSKEEVEQLVVMAKALEDEITSGTKDSINKAMEVLNVFSRPLAEKALDIKVAEALKTRKL